MFYDIIILAAIAVYLAILVVGFMVFRSNPQKNAHKFFLLFTIFFTLWLISNFLEIWIPEESLAVFFLYADFVLAPFFTLYLFLFLLSFPKERFKDKKNFFTLMHLPAFIISVLVPLGLVIGEVQKNDYHMIFKEEAFFVVYALVCALYMFGGIGYAIANHLTHTGLQKHQTRMILLGFAIVSFTLFVGNVFLQNIIGPKLFLLINLSSVVLPICITIAILKHRFMGLKSIYRSYTTFLLLFLFTLIYAVLIKETLPVITKMVSVGPVSVLATYSAVFVPLFMFMERQVKHFADKLFSNHLNFRHLFDEILTEISFNEGPSSKVDTLIEKVELVTGIKPTVLLAKGKNNYKYYGSPLGDLQEKRVTTLSANLLAIKKTVIRGQLKYLSLMPGGRNERLHDVLEKEQIQIVIPILESTDNGGDIFRGSILLRDKRFRYTRDEISFLEMLAPQLSSYL